MKVKPVIAIVPLGHSLYFQQFEGLYEELNRKAAAFAAGRDFVLPEDAAELVPYVFGHRLMLSSRAKLNDYTPEAILAQVLEETPAPAMTERTL